MNYKLKFLPSALKEWKKLDASIQTQFKKKLTECLRQPHLPKNRLSGFENHYKIKLRASGYRMVYEVMDHELFVVVIAVGKREKNAIYKTAKKRNRPS